MKNKYMPIDIDNSLATYGQLIATISTQTQLQNKKNTYITWVNVFTTVDFQSAYNYKITINNILKKLINGTKVKFFVYFRQESNNTRQSVLFLFSQNRKLYLCADKDVFTYI